MKCPRCGRKMVQDSKHTFCLFCGYMDKGIQIKKESDYSASDVEIYLGKHYDAIYHNQTNYLILFLGPFYFCFRKHILLGTTFFFFDILVYFYSLLLFPGYSLLALLLSFCILRIFYMTVSNMIILKLAEKKIEKLKRKDPDHYLDLLRSLSDTSGFSILQLIIGIGIVLVIGAFIFLMKDFFL